MSTSVVVSAPEVLPFRHGAASEAETASPFLTFGEILRALLRQKLIVCLAVAGCGMLALAAAYTRHRVYQAKALIEVQSINENFLNRREIEPAVDGVGAQFDAYVQTQIKLIQTTGMLGGVADRLHLERHPEFQPGRGIADRLRGLFKTAAPASADGRREAMLAEMARRLTVRLSGETRIIEIAFEAGDPAMATVVANTLAGEYVEANLQKRLSATRHTATWLAGQMTELKGNLDTAETELQRFLMSHDLLSASDAEKDTIAEARLRQLQTALTAAQEARIADQSRYELVSKLPVEELSNVIDTETMQKYHTRLTELRQKDAEARIVYKPDYYKVKQVQAEIAALQAALERERRETLSRLRSQFEASSRREKMIAADLKQQMGVVRTQSVWAVEYNTLKRAVDTYRKLYDSTLERAKETQLAAAIRANNVHVAENAVKPVSPVRPGKAMYLTVGTMAGFLFGSVLALHRDRKYRLVNAPGELRTRLGIAELGPIPCASVDLPYSVKPGSLLPRLGSYGRKEAADEKADLLRNWLETVTWRQRESSLAESYRGAIASLLRSGGQDPLRVIVVTSACAGEGKTTTVTNLGIALAESGKRVLLIDADRRRPHLHEIFRRSNAFGFSDFLLQDSGSMRDLAATISPTEVPRLDILPGGSDRSCVPHLVDNIRVAQLLAWLRQHYDTILIDTPPMMALSDARGLARMADGVALVIRAGMTPEHVLMAVTERLRDDGARVLGGVLNNWKPVKDGMNYYGAAAYGYRQSDYKAV
jgi:capsular exopolysaccharide synthesis family protein